MKPERGDRPRVPAAGPGTGEAKKVESLTPSDRRKKVVFAVALPPPYHGSNNANAALWGSELQDRHRCYLVDLSDRRGLDNLGRLDIVNVYLALRSIFDLLRIVIRRKPDILYINLSQNALAYLRDGLLIACARITGVPVIIAHLHGSYFKTFYEKSNVLVRRFIDSTLSRAEMGIVLGENLKPILGRWIPRILVVPNGTDVCRDIDLAAKLERRRREAPTVTMLSNLTRAKGVFDLLDAAPLIAADYPNVRIRIAGQWAYDPVYRESAESQRLEAEKLLADHGLAKNVEFLGVVKGQEKVDLLLDTDIFVLTSRQQEGQPLSILEAMAAGCVVISTENGAIPETVVDGETGVLIEPGDPETLAGQISGLLSDAHRLEEMARRARRRYERQYTQERFVENMLTVFGTA